MSIFFVGIIPLRRNVKAWVTTVLHAQKCFCRRTHLQSFRWRKGICACSLPYQLKCTICRSSWSGKLGNSTNLGCFWNPKRAHQKSARYGLLQAPASSFIGSIFLLWKLFALQNPRRVFCNFLNHITRKYEMPISSNRKTSYMLSRSLAHPKIYSSFRAGKISCLWRLPSMTIFMLCFRNFLSSTMRNQSNQTARLWLTTASLSYKVIMPWR